MMKLFLLLGLLFGRLTYMAQLVFGLFLLLSFYPLFGFSFVNNFYIDMISFFLSFMLLWVSLMVVLVSFLFYEFIYVVLIYGLMFTLFLCFLVKDFFSFYFYFEFSLIPIVLILGGWGYQFERLEAFIYLLFYTFVFSMPLLFCFFNYYSIYLVGAFYLNLVYALNYFMMFVYLMALSLAFLVKLPFFMFHLWLPKAHVEAPVGGSMILASVMLKLGGYGIFRVGKVVSCLFVYYSSYYICVCLFCLVITSYMAVRMVDLKILIAYSSVGHMGLVLIGLMFMSSNSMFGAYSLMLGHGLSSSVLFYLINVFYSRSGTRSIFLLKGMQIYSVLMVFAFMISVSNMSVPPFFNLINEILLMSSVLMFSLVGLMFMFLGGALVSVFSIFFFSSLYSGFMFSYMSIFSSLNTNEFLVLSFHLIPINFLVLSFNLFV